MLFCPIYRLRLSPQPGGQAGWKGGSVSRSRGFASLAQDRRTRCRIFVKRATPSRSRLRGASDDRRQVLGELVVLSPRPTCHVVAEQQHAGDTDEQNSDDAIERLGG